MSSPPTSYFCRSGSIQLVSAIVMSAWSSVMAGSQATRAGALSEALQAHVRDERFQVVTSIRGLPLGVRHELETLFGSHALDIAETTAPFQATNVAATPRLPSRRLVTAGCSMDHCLVYYERAGIRSWRAALFHWTPTATRFESGGTAPAALKTVEAVRKAFLSGAIKDAKDVW